MTRGHRHPHASAFRTAFTLIELMVVIGIIALVVGILVPTLGAVRDAARKTASTALANDVVTASSSFITDQRRAPGHFPQAMMGTEDNATSGGFTNSENALLDLAGGIVAATGANNPDPAQNTYVDVGPVAGGSIGGSGPLGPGGGSQGEPEIVRVDNALVGTGRAGGGYLTLKDDVLIAVDGQFGSDPTTPGYGPTAMVDIVDFFGQPLLIWTPDETAVPPTSRFALKYAGDTDPVPLSDRARFYWGSNAGYLSANRLGQRGIAQSALSILGLNRDDDEIAASLEGILGSPAYPGPDPDSPNRTIPLRARGKVVVISAGPDQIYFSSRQDPGSEVAGDTNSVGKVVDYAPRPDSSSAGDPRNNEVDAFDDIVLGSGD